MFWTFNLSLDILATVWATFPDIGQIYVQFSGHSAHKYQTRVVVGGCGKHTCLQCRILITALKVLLQMPLIMMKVIKSDCVLLLMIFYGF